MTGSSKRHNVFKIANKESVCITKFIADYRQTQILMTTFNAVFSELGPLLQATWMCTTIAVLIFLIRTSDWSKRLAGFAILATNIAIGIIYNQVSGIVYEESKETLLLRSRKSHFKSLKLRYRALHPLRVFCGSMFYFDKGIFISAIRIIQDNTITILLA
ncbi:unnamed protein product [Allacma fusca]|uniref:Uncharacterized protein n=1 Tax=Allacma fusca TaxID=39272 RepID=A0A8J2L826_9HEXA|nr:unnamed protein product [Allacma fusca]